MASRLVNDEAVRIGLPRHDGVLGHARHTILCVWNVYAMPMHRNSLVNIPIDQLHFDQVAFVHHKHWPGNLTVERPRFDDMPRRKFNHLLLRDEFKPLVGRPGLRARQFGDVNHSVVARLCGRGMVVMMVVELW